MNDALVNARLGRAALLAVLSCLPWWPASLVAATLSRDPFEQPHATAAPTASAPSAPLVPALPPWQGRLLMTLRAGPRSMVNIDGVSVALGERYRGFELIAVDERAAIFRRGAERIDLSLDEPPPLVGGGDYVAVP
ncbi:MAG: hypothetical protein AB7Q81_20685 [Gammaproteobacteria bacterium]